MRASRRTSGEGPENVRRGPSERLVKPRTLEPGDVEAVLALQHDCPELAQWTRSDYERVAQGEMSGWVAEQDGALSGFLIARDLRDEIEILNVAVSAPARRQQIGTSLLSAALEWGRVNSARRVFLEVRKSNQAAISFYEKHGFSAAGRRKRYYNGPIEDAIVLAAEIR